MKTLNVLSGFSGPDSQRINQTLEHLLPHLIPDEFAIVGGLAIRYFVTRSGRTYPNRPFNDLDIIVKRRESVASSIAEELKITHFHDNERGYYWAVVDPASKVKVDIFQWPACEPTIITVPWGDRSLPLQSVEDQLAKTIFDTTRVLDNAVVDPKQFADARLLKNIADPERTSRIFAQLYGNRTPVFETPYDALGSAEQKAANHPELLVAKLFHIAEPHTCTGCTVSSAYPLTSLAQIRDETF